MKLFVCLLLILGFSGCAHRKPKDCEGASSCKKAEVKESVAFEGHCAMGLCEKKKVKGHPDYKVEYKGKVYYFSTSEAKDKFLSKIDHHIKQATVQWETYGADRVK